MTTKKLEGPLSLAAAELEAELEAFQRLVSDLGRLHINSDKALDRARQHLEACSDFEQKLAGRLQVFAEAMQTLQARQQECMKSALDHAQRIQARNEARNALLARVNTLGLSARDINAPMDELMTDAAGRTDSALVLSKMQEVGERLQVVIAEASTLANLARDQDWQDIARDADTLKQELLGVRNKVLLAQRNVASRAPS
jgi:hypothetical protein